MGYPNRWWITPNVVKERDVVCLLKLLEERVAQGFEHIIYRQTCIDDSTRYQHIFHMLKAHCDAMGAHIMVNAPIAVAKCLKQEQIYLNSDVLIRLHEKPFTDGWVGAYCHNLAQLQHAQALALNFVSLSPVKRTATHPETQALGWQHFASLTGQVTIPVYALGGMTLADQDIALAHGAHGIMGIRL